LGGPTRFLLIVAALKAGATKVRFTHLATTHKMRVLVEVHTRDEIGMAVDATRKLSGYNNRNLATLEVDLRHHRKIAAENCLRKSRSSAKRHPNDGGFEAGWRLIR